MNCSLALKANFVMVWYGKQIWICTSMGTTHGTFLDNTRWAI